jgi:uncharacterized protein (TIGR01777 family)
MKVFVTGGTGFVGSRLVRRLVQEGHAVMVLTRSRRGRDIPGAEMIEGDPVQPGPWQEKLAGAEWVINLAGSSISRRWNPEVKKDLRDSRIFTTRNVVDAIPDKAGTTLFNASAIGYYGFHGDEELRENAPSGSDFLGLLARDCEQEAMSAAGRGARVVITRFGLVLGEKGGLLGSLIPVFKRFLGGPVGSGKQWVSWVHIDDLVNSFLFLIDRRHVSGPVNITSPNPVRNAEFSKALAEALKVPAFLTVPGFAARIALGEFAKAVLNGQRVIPGVLLAEGFPFSHPDIYEALRDVIASWRE